MHASALSTTFPHHTFALSTPPSLTTTFPLAFLLRRYTYSRTFVTVLNTSATTFLAFVATASAPIMPIASFGVFAAFAIIFNWVLTVTW